jgi:hypothetical protein
MIYNFSKKIQDHLLPGLMDAESLYVCKSKSTQKEQLVSVINKGNGMRQKKVVQVVVCAERRRFEIDMRRDKKCSTDRWKLYWLSAVGGLLEFGFSTPPQRIPCHVFSCVGLGEKQLRGKRTEEDRRGTTGIFYLFHISHHIVSSFQHIRSSLSIIHPVQNLAIMRGTVSTFFLCQRRR